MVGFAQQWWDFDHAKCAWEDSLDDRLPENAEYDRLRSDSYDGSLEIDGAINDLRLEASVQQFIRDAGFHKVYVNHQDGWQTHYDLSGTVPVRGWRRRYVEDASAKTTNVIGGPANPGYYEISYWPTGWVSPGCADWLSSGYMRIVPDPLEIAA